MAVERDAIRVDGLRDFQAALKAVEDGAQKALKVVLDRAALVVVADAQRLVPVLSGRAKASIKVASQQREARVKAGGSRAPYFGFLDYGNKVDGGLGAVGRGDSHPRPFVKSGRYIYPAYRANKPEIEQIMVDGLRDLAAQHGIEMET